MPKRSDPSGPWPSLTFRIPAELRDRLQAATGDRPVGEEIRQRLENSFGPAPTVDDKTTKRLLAGIAAMADFFAAVPGPVATMLGVTGGLPGPWYKDPISFAALQSAILMLLRLLGPGEVQELDEALWKPLSAMALNAGLSEAGVGDRVHVGEARKERRR
jgi:hypothetical protein